MGDKKRINNNSVQNPRTLVDLLNAMYTEITALRTAVAELMTDHATQVTLNAELIADHATFKTEIDEIHTWAETLAGKLNSDGGVTDADYDATIAAATTATLTAAGPATLAASAPTQQCIKGV